MSEMSLEAPLISAEAVVVDEPIEADPTPEEFLDGEADVIRGDEGEGI